MILYCISRVQPGCQHSTQASDSSYIDTKTKKKRKKFFKTKKTRTFWVSLLNVERFPLFACTFLLVKENSRYMFFKYIRMSLGQFDGMCDAGWDSLADSVKIPSTLDDWDILTHELPLFSSYRNHLIDLLCKSIGSFLYEGNTGT